MKVKNINGTSDTNCVCGSWLKHWENFSSKKASNCSEATCMEYRDLVGAHVRKDSFLDNEWYIIPLCKKHNAKATDLEVSEGTVFVSANKSKTCDKF